MLIRVKLQGRSVLTVGGAERVLGVVGLIPARIMLRPVAQIPLLQLDGVYPSGGRGKNHLPTNLDRPAVVAPDLRHDERLSVVSDSPPRDGELAHDSAPGITNCNH